MTRIFDITVPVIPNMPVWPGEAPPRFEHTSTMDAGDGLNVSRISLGVHTGTHVDSPGHFVANGGSVDELELATLIGPALLVTFSGVAAITASDLEGAAIPPETHRS